MRVGFCVQVIPANVLAGSNIRAMMANDVLLEVGVGSLPLNRMAVDRFTSIRYHRGHECSIPYGMGLR